ERAEANERHIVRHPRAQLVALVAAEIADGVVLREALELRILLRSGCGHGAGAGGLADDVAAQSRIRVVAADVEAARRAEPALQHDRLIGAAKVVAVDEIAEIELLTDER